MQEIARIFKKLRQYSRNCDNIQEIATICKKLRQYSRNCDNIQEIATIFKKLRQYSRNCNNIQGNSDNIQEIGIRKMKNLNLLCSDAESSPGNHITPPYVRVPGADGTTCWGRRVRAGEICTPRPLPPPISQAKIETSVLCTFMYVLCTFHLRFIYVLCTAAKRRKSGVRK